MNDAEDLNEMFKNKVKQDMSCLDLLNQETIDFFTDERLGLTQQYMKEMYKAKPLILEGFLVAIIMNIGKDFDNAYTILNNVKTLIIENEKELNNAR